MSITDVKVSIARVETKLDTFIEQMAKQDDRTTKLDARVRKVENRQHWYSGAAAVVGTLFGTAGQKLFHS
jgi:hypothetical protein